MKGKIVKSLPGDLQKFGSPPLLTLGVSTSYEDPGQLGRSSCVAQQLGIMALFTCIYRPNHCFPVPSWKTLNYILFQEEERDCYFISGNLFKMQ